jgi:hypothetical protein
MTLRSTGQEKENNTKEIWEESGSFETFLGL